MAIPGQMKSDWRRNRWRQAYLSVPTNEHAEKHSSQFSFIPNRSPAV